LQRFGEIAVQNSCNTGRRNEEQGEKEGYEELKGRETKESVKHQKQTNKEVNDRKKVSYMKD
jgi:hypothetical protein